MTRKSTQERIEASLARSEAKVFVRRDFARFGSESQIGRALAALVAKGALARVGRGIYVKARPSSLTGKPVPVIPLTEIGLLALAKLGVQADLGASARAYNEGRTTQIPMATVLSVGSARISRKIGFGKQVIRFER